MSETLPEPGCALGKGIRLARGQPALLALLDRFQKLAGKLKDIGWLVSIAVVAPQAFDHAERVGRPFEQLRELLVVERESCALRRLCTGLACCGISLVGGTR